VLLDVDLAALYEVSGKALKQAVRRNRERFPDDFMFELTWEETRAVLRSQVVTLKQGANYKYWSSGTTHGSKRSSTLSGT
jgi:hypothetical protein